MRDYSVLEGVVFRFGDVNPAVHGGGVVLQDENDFSVEYTHGNEDQEESLLTIYRCDLPDDVLGEFDWAEDHLEDHIGYDPDLDKNSPYANRGRTLREVGASKDYKERLMVLEAVGSCHGWHELDNYPIKLSERALNIRWGRDTLPTLRVHVDGDDDVDNILTNDGCWKMMRSLGQFDLVEGKFIDNELGIYEFEPWCPIYINGVPMSLRAIVLSEENEPYKDGEICVFGMMAKVKANQPMIDALFLLNQHLKDTIMINDEPCVMYLTAARRM